MKQLWVYLGIIGVWIGSAAWAQLPQIEDYRGDALALCDTRYSGHRTGGQTGHYRVPNWAAPADALLTGKVNHSGDRYQH